MSEKAAKEEPAAVPVVLPDATTEAQRALFERVIQLEAAMRLMQLEWLDTHERLMGMITRYNSRIAKRQSAESEEPGVPGPKNVVVAQRRRRGNY